MTSGVGHPPRVYRSEAVVLKARDYGEADRILTLYTPHAGKVHAIAKGVRRTKSRMAGHVDLFTRSTLLIAHGRQLDIITQADTVDNFREIRQSLERTSYCAYVAELIDGFSAEQLANYPLYALLVSTFRRLTITNNLDMVVWAFQINLLGVTGYRPQLHRCLSCDTLIEPRNNTFSAKLGGILCPACGTSDAGADIIDASALKVLRNLQTNEAAMLLVPTVPRHVVREIERHLHEYLQYRLESRPKSLNFLNRLRLERSNVL
ncbi:MAG: DNA repair protein RecO [Chloroflexota bacterium]